ncbi:MAG: amino acid permease [Myxococcota bacterium]|jgi:arginine:ornithine antiporter/lysine permease|nr:arginine:agmatine antiporter [Deltaproteobacteria bacterium]MCP4245209.1 amino acid permease [bacterium]MDP7074363.1 amino acid permease [Myxococcota bacterium]MDP7300518.1 amino acid permease [Myxococcota bacterium]MDP7434116.1 amino acid permease [Myxococcota bacterium]
MANERKGNDKKLGLTGLVAIVVSSMIGGGIFDLPSNMTAATALGAVLIAWLITGIGMYSLANTFRSLSDKRPDLTSGIYEYSREAFGRFVGFEMAWGYWLSAAFGNVAFAVLIMDTLSFFFPVFGDGKNLPSVIGGSALIWTMHFFVLRGISGAAALNVVGTVAKLVPLVVIVLASAIAFKWDTFQFDFWGQEEHLGSILSQVKSTMLVTLWAFIGIEGAVVIGRHARTPKLVGQSTLIGLFSCLVIYVFLSVLPFGVLHQKELAALTTPSTAYLLQHIVGYWGAVFVNIGVLIALLSAWLAWTILVAEVPHTAATDGVFPKWVAGENKHGAPAAALWLSSIIMQLAIFVVLLSDNAWLFLLSITGVMVLPPYLTSCAFLWKLSISGHFPIRGPESQRWSHVTGTVGTFYAIWLLFAAGPSFLLMSVVFFGLGMPLYHMAHKELSMRELFAGRDAWLAGTIVILMVVAVFLFATGNIKI